MSQAAVDAFRAEREHVLALGRSLSDEEWAAPSDCDGWTVKDVFAHLVMGLRLVVDPASVPSGNSGDAEQDVELGVAARKDAPPSELLEEYEAVSAQALEAFAGLQNEPLASTPIPMQNLGTHPMHLVANAFAFDHYCHLRTDVLGPIGPIDRPPLPRDELRLAPTIEWMLAGLPQMCEEALAKVVTAPVSIVLTGPGSSSLTLGGDGEVAATITSSADDFVVWGTQRRPWRDFDVTIDGDVELGSAVADNINVI